MTPEEVEQRVSTPVEQELLGLPHKTMVRSVSKYGISDVTVDFSEGTDVYWARQQVSERLAGLQRELPATAEGGLAPISTPLGEMFMFTIDGEQWSLAERRHVLDWVIRDRKSTRLNSSHLVISYAVFCLKKKKHNNSCSHILTNDLS